MNELAPDLTQQVLHPEMHQKILLRAADLVAMGWTRGTAARDVTGQKVRSTEPQATAWCVVGAVDRVLYELLNVDVYDLAGPRGRRLRYSAVSLGGPARAPAAARTRAGAPRPGALE
jgi:hypothetical protein